MTTREVVEALVIEDAEDEEARMAAERERGGGIAFIARLERYDGGPRAQPLALEVDVTRLQFFDPETGTVVGESPDAAGS